MLKDILKPFLDSVLMQLNIIDNYMKCLFCMGKENLTKFPEKGKTYNGFSYSINQEKYLRVFLKDGAVSLDNNAAEQSTLLADSISEKALGNDRHHHWCKIQCYHL